MERDECSRTYQTHCTAGRSLWRPLIRAACGLALLWSALGATPAMADDNLRYLDVACGSGLTLNLASGVPSGATHVYRFGGVCNFLAIYGNGTLGLAHPPISASAKWDVASQTYTESLHLLAGMSVNYNSPRGSNGEFVTGESANIGTGAETATFRCNTDPVLTRSASCTLVSSQNATGWGRQGNGFDYDARHNRPLLLGVVTQAQAAQLSRSDNLPSINCSGMKLTYAAGVPGSAKHAYKFGGTCQLYQTAFGDQGLQVTRVAADGAWDSASNQASQTLKVLVPASAGGGSWSAKYTCSGDPWLDPRAQCSRSGLSGPAATVYDPVTNLFASRPLGAPVDLAKAEQLSLLSAPMHLMKPSNFRASNSSTPRLTKAKLVIEYIQPTVTRHCTPHGMIDVGVAVRDEGGPLPPHTRLAFIRISELGGAELNSAAVQLPEIMPGRTWSGLLHVGTDAAHRSRLPGRHTLTAAIGPKLMVIGSMPYVPAPPKRFKVNLPAGYCQTLVRARNPNVTIHAGATSAPATGTRAVLPLNHISVLHH